MPLACRIGAMAFILPAEAFPDGANLKPRRPNKGEEDDEKNAAGSGEAVSPLELAEQAQALNSQPQREP